MNQPELSKQQLEAGIKAAESWSASLRRGTFAGADCQPIAGLIAYLDEQHRSMLEIYEGQLAIHPEWGVPSSLGVKLNDGGAGKLPGAKLEPEWVKPEEPKIGNHADCWFEDATGAFRAGPESDPKTLVGGCHKRQATYTAKGWIENRFVVMKGGIPHAPEMAEAVK
jgi:hypothetical protein